MKSSLVAFAVFAATVTGAALPNVKRSAISITPHDTYSSSAGVLGCKIDTNRVAYFPSAPNCANPCIKVTANGQSLHLLHIDQSGGAFDMSYDAWNMFNTGGQSATTDPTTGGGIPATMEQAPFSECAGLIQDGTGKLPLTAANGMNFAMSCPSMESVTLYNIYDTNCLMGVDEVCQMPPPSVSNQPQCPHTLGLQTPLEGHQVKNIQYGTGEESDAQ